MIFKREIPRSEARSDLRCIAFPTPRSHRDVESREKLYSVFVLRSRAKISDTLVEYLIHVSAGYHESTPSPQTAIMIRRRDSWMISNEKCPATTAVSYCTRMHIVPQMPCSDSEVSFLAQKVIKSQVTCTQKGRSVPSLISFDDSYDFHELTSFPSWL